MPGAAAVQRAAPAVAYLSGPAAFRRVFASKLRSSDGQMAVIGRLNEIGNVRLGFALSRKNVRSAVQRNRIKRVVRESVRKHAAELAGLDLVVVGRRGVADLENAALRRALERHWRRLCDKRRAFVNQQGDRA